MRYATKDVVEKHTKAKWNDHGILINGIKDLVIEFVVHVFAHKFYQSIRLNNVPCITVNLGYMIAKKDHNYDLAEL